MNEIKKEQLTFDQYQRYETIAEMIEYFRLETAGAPFRLLEVGANEHKDMALFLPKDKILYTDITLTEAMERDPEFQQADGANLPFEDGTFDFVYSCDVLEHIPEEKRQSFLLEAARVAKRCAILCFPFNSRDIVEAEQRVNAHYQELTGEEFIWLKEHRENGLPDITTIESILRNLGLSFFSFCHGNVSIWEKMWRCKFDESFITGPKDYESIDYFYNHNLYRRDISESCYRVFYAFSHSDLAPLEERMRTYWQAPLPGQVQLLEMLCQSYRQVHPLRKSLRELSQEKEKRTRCQVQLFFDTGDGFNEGQMQDISCTYDEDLELRFPVEKDVRAVRVDPAMEPVLVIVKKCCALSAEGLWDLSPASNGLPVGNAFVFDTDDPQLFLSDLDPDIREIRMTLYIMHLTPVAAEEYARQQYREKKEQEHQLQMLTDRQNEEKAALAQEQERLVQEIERLRKEAQWRQEEAAGQLNELAERLAEQREKLEAENQRMVRLTEDYQAAVSTIQQRREEYDALKAKTDQALSEGQRRIQALEQELARANENYETISNAFFWKVSAPARKALDVVKSCICKLKKLARLSRKGVRVLRDEGFQAFQEKYKAYREREKAYALGFKETASAAAKNAYFRDGQPEPDIPLEWMEIQKDKPLISIVMAVKDLSRRADCFVRALDSLDKQKYKNFELVIAAAKVELDRVQELLKGWPGLTVRLVPAADGLRREEYWDLAMSEARGGWIGLLEQEDALTENALAYVLEGVNESSTVQLFVLPDDRFFTAGEYLLPDYKVGVDWNIGGWESLLRFGIFKNLELRFENGMLERWLRELEKEKILTIPWVACHGQALPSVWEEQPVRCIAFYLPQFHVIPENNKWWGEGFTEWVNVNAAKPLYPGHHQPRKPTELGCYDLAGESGREIQKRQMALAKEYGLSGFCYYYYWFDGGKRLLEMPLNRHLADKSMDFPFCLCWANENWTRQWDGLKSEIIMPQTYQEGWAENFMRDMIPYITDSRYIRVNGAPYILIYNLEDMVDPAGAINTWRRIAAENGIPRLHISAVRRTVGARELEASGHTIDSLTDFPPHLLGLVGVDHDNGGKFGLAEGQVKDYRKACNYHVRMGKQPYAYFRTAMLEWDNTARRKDKAYIFEEFSLEAYQKWLYAGKRYVLRQNMEGENLLFINAWNEWAEGTYLEPSQPNARAALEATAEVLKMR